MAGYILRIRRRSDYRHVGFVRYNKDGVRLRATRVLARRDATVFTCEIDALRASHKMSFFKCFPAALFDMECLD